MLRTWVILISVMSILVSIVVAERVIISDFEKENNICISKITEKLYNGEIQKKDLEKIKNMWNDRKKLIYMFANHNSFSSIENSIAYMEECAESANHSMFRIQLITYEKCVKSVIESTILSVANIL